jgi:hypothetical protein
MIRSLVIIYHGGSISSLENHYRSNPGVIRSEKGKFARLLKPQKMIDVPSLQTRKGGK